MTKTAAPHCINCISWRIESQYVRKHDGKHVLHGPCVRTQGFQYEPDDKTSLAFAIASSLTARDGVSILNCDEDFGCVQFQVRTESAIADSGITEDAIAYAKERRDELEGQRSPEVSDE